MNDTEPNDRLTPWLRGELDAAAEEELLAAAGDDAALAAEAEDYRRLIAGLRALPREAAPDHDLFPAVAVRARIHDRPRSRRAARPVPPARGWRRLPRWAPALAAGLVLALGVVLMGRLERPPLPAGGRAEGSVAVEAPAPPATAAAAEGALAHTAYADTDRELARIHDELQRAVEARAGGLPPATRQLLFDNLEVIDRALQEIEDALAAEPSNPELARTYIGYRRRQIDLLLQANRAATRL